MLISKFFQLEIEFYFESDLHSHWSRENNGLLDHLLFYRSYITSFIHSSFNTIHGFRLDTSMYSMALIHPY